MNALGNNVVYGSHASFYKDVYGQHVSSLSSFGSKGSSVMEAVQSSGDWSDAPVPDLAIAWLASNPVGFSYDLGAGRFSGAHRTNDAILIAPGAGATIQVYGPHVCRVVAIPYAWLESCADGELPVDGDFGSLHSGLLRSSDLLSSLEAIWLESSRGNARGKLYADGLLLQVTSAILRLDREKASRPASGGLAPWQVNRVTDFMEEHLSDDVSLDDLSALLGLSPFHLCRAFKNSVGEPPHRWRQKRRLERAAEMLIATDVPVIEVAAAVGYEDPSRFATAFRKMFRVNPSIYRRERAR